MQNKRIIAVPTLFTSFNLFCGFLSILLTSAGHYTNAAWLIYIAGVFDALDGKIARAVGHSSEFGLQMDSLSDVVSAGVAPAFLVYEFYLKNLGYVGIILAFSPLLFGALRLARYNVTTSKSGKAQDYTGMPAPMAATALGSSVIFFSVTQWAFIQRMVVILVPAVSLLMISSIKYSGFPRFSLKEKGANRRKLLLLFGSLTIFIIFPRYFLFPFMLFYLFSGPVAAISAIIRNEDAHLEIIPENSEQ
jgi:CDP-diacylglycerol--serine O-phosphatidyltransferase